jgi:DNA repair protein RadC
MPDDNIHANHRARMRKRYIEQGIEAFAEHEILEMLLYYCYPRRDTNETAHLLINDYGSLHNLMDADPRDIQSRCGISENAAVLISMIPQLAKRYTQSKWDVKTIMRDADTAGHFAVSLFVDATTEVFYIICLDKQCRVNYVARMTDGTLDETAIYPREVFGVALRHHAEAVILSHNHPGGTLRPSRKDIEMTRRLKEGFDYINVDIIDHIIVAEGKYYSMAKRGQFVSGYPGS